MRSEPNKRYCEWYVDGKVLCGKRAVSKDPMVKKWPEQHNRWVCQYHFEAALKHLASWDALDENYRSE